MPKKIPFWSILSTLDESMKDKKQALMVKIVEEGWRITTVFYEG